MITLKYKKCLVQVEEILRHLTEDELNKIPQEIRKAIIEQKDKNYVWTYDESKSLSEQNIDRQTIAMLSYINMEYLLDEEQKALMEEIHRANEKKKRLKKSCDVEKIIVKDIPKESLVVKTKKEKWYQRLIMSIKNLIIR